MFGAQRNTKCELGGIEVLLTGSKAKPPTNPSDGQKQASTKKEKKQATTTARLLMHERACLDSCAGYEREATGEVLGAGEPHGCVNVVVAEAKSWTKFKSCHVYIHMCTYSLKS